MARRRTLNVSLPENVVAWIDQRVERGEFADANECILEALKRARTIHTKAELEEAALAGFRSEAKPLTPGVWRQIRREVESRAAARSKTMRRKRTA